MRASRACATTSAQPDHDLVGAATGRRGAQPEVIRDIGNEVRRGGRVGPVPSRRNRSDSRQLLSETGVQTEVRVYMRNVSPIRLTLKIDLQLLTLYGPPAQV